MPLAVLVATFDTDDDGFEYADDAFGTAAPSYADGVRIVGDEVAGGALQVLLGGVDDEDVVGISGGWRRAFELEDALPLTLSLRLRLTMAANYEDDERGFVLAAVDDLPVGPAATDFVAQLVGDGNGGDPVTTGWRRFELDLGLVASGSHTLTIGGSNSKKTLQDEETEVLIDDVSLIEAATGPPAPGADLAVSRLDFDRFRDNIETLAGFGDRTQGTESFDQASAWIEGELQAAGYAAERHAYTFRGDPRESLFATKVGSRFPDRMLIVSAHLDGRGGGGGADDDASGSSLVLEAARVLAAADFETAISVRFVFWNNEETGLNGSSAYAADRVSLQGREDPPGSGRFPEPVWVGVIQHDMILFDHGLPPTPEQDPAADVDIEFQASSDFALSSEDLATALFAGNATFSTDYPAEIGNDMSNTDSVPFQDRTAAVSVRENQRRAEIGQGANPHWHQPTDVLETYGEADFRLGFNALQMTLGTVSEIAGLTLIEDRDASEDP